MNGGSPIASPVNLENGTGIGVSNPSASNVQFSLNNTAVTPGSYTNANITVNAQGQLTTARTGTSGVEVNGGSPLAAPVNLQNATGITVSNPSSSNVQFTLNNTAVTPGSYTSANITVNQQGEITAASSGPVQGTASPAYLGNWENTQLALSPTAQGIFKR